MDLVTKQNVDDFKRRYESGEFSSCILLRDDKSEIIICKREE